MVAIRAHFDGKALIPDQPVDLPRDRALLVHVETERDANTAPPLLGPLLTPSNPDAARRLIGDVESGLENF